MLETATITLSYEAFRTLQDKAADLERQLVTMQTTQTQTKLADTGEEGAKILAGLLAARRVVGFAISELPPESTRGWPLVELRAFAEMLRDVRCDDPDVPESGRDFLRFVDEAEAVEAMRRDETVHGRDAVLAGAAELPSPVRELMRATAKIMTVTAARL